MHVYIEEFGLSTTKQNKLLMLALGGSILLHGASFFLVPTQLTNNQNPPAPYATPISHGNMQRATKLVSPDIDDFVPEVALDAPGIISHDKTITDIGTSVEISGLDTSVEISSPDALATSASDAQAVDALVAKPVELTSNIAQASIVSDIGLQNLLPVDRYTSALVSEDIAISFSEIPGPNAQIPALLITKVTDLIEQVPVINETTIINKVSPVSPLFGITGKFKQQIKKQLGKSIVSIKPKIVKQKLAGSLRFQFTINRSGKLVSSKINKSSGNKKLDALVLKMLKDNSPYGRLPDKYPGELLRFSYPISVKFK